MGNFHLNSDGSATYDLGDGTYIYTPANNGTKDPITGQEIDNPIIVDKNGNPVPGITPEQARAIEAKNEGAGSTYGTSTPGSGKTLGWESGALATLLGGPAGAAAWGFTKEEGDPVGQQVGSAIDAVKDGITTQPPPGTLAGPPKDSSRLVQDPVTGYWKDPSTGQSYYKDASGNFQSIQDTNVAQLSTQAGNLSDYFNSLSKDDRDKLINSLSATQGEAGNIDATGQAVINNTANLTAEGDRLNGQADKFNENASQFDDAANSFLNTINNPNAPSVARAQLKQGLEANQRQQLSAAAGVGGNNAYLASRTAATNANQANLATNQAQALVRAQEVANAQKSLVDALSGKTTALSGATTADTNAGTQFNNAGTQLKSAGDLFKGAGDLNSKVSDTLNNIRTTDINTGKSYLDTAGNLEDSYQKTNLAARQKNTDTTNNFLSSAFNKITGAAGTATGATGLGSSDEEEPAKL